MSAATYFSESNKKGEVSELKRSLQSPEVQRDAAKYKKVIQKVIACMTLGMDLSSLFLEMIKAGATHDLAQKKLIYLYICSYATSNPELALLTVNTLRKDSQDSSAMVRGLALRSMCSLRLPNLLEYIEEPVLSGLTDRSTYVRRSAVMGCIKLYHLVPDFIEDHGIKEKLETMLYDTDSQVVCNCISALDEILAAEGGLMMDQKLAYSLLKRLKTFSEWGQSLILEVMLRYTPSNTEELFDILNLLDDRLKHPNSAVVMACIRLFIHLTKDIEGLSEDVYKRIKGPLLTILSSSNSELVYICLCHVELLLSKAPQMLDQEYRTFFSRHSDPQYIKTRKLKLLTSIASAFNVEEIVTELSANVHDVDIGMSRESIKAIGKIAFCLPEASEYCIDALLTFLSWEIEYITSQTLVVIRDLLLKYEKLAIAVLPQLPECLEIVQDPKGLAAIIWMVGEYGQLIPDSPYMLEPLIDRVSTEQSAEVKLQLLTATMKLFFKKPPECQGMLGELLKFCVGIRNFFTDDENHMDVHDRALLYYRLLKANVKEAERVVCGSSPKPSSHSLDANNIDVKTKEPLFEEFNTLSVVYGKLSSQFIPQTIPYIKGKPYTQDDDEDISYLAENFEKHELKPLKGQNVTVGNLLGDDINPEKDKEEIVIDLCPHPALTPAQFEQKWKSLQQSSSWEEEMLTSPSTPEEFQRQFVKNRIALMASSPPGQTIQRYFFYAQESTRECFFLVEAVINVPTQVLSIVTKAEDELLVEAFDALLQHCLQGK